ncbi:MAG: two-component sensor histidine kinase, partial [Mycolicibacterium sp.]|nr:two-component sensor histidine kinase [Mycolicibacterium sp.]
MSSSPPASGGPGTRVFSPRTWSLRVRLLVTQIVLLATVCAAIGVATEFALQRFLMHQLDEQVLEAGRRSTAIFDMPLPPGVFGRGAGRESDAPGPPGPAGSVGPPEPPRIVLFPAPPDFPLRQRFDPETGPGPGFLNAPGQAARTVGAVVERNSEVDAGVIT